MEGYKKFSRLKVGLIVLEAVAVIIAIIFNFIYKSNMTNIMFFILNLVIFVSTTSWRMYKDWKIKEEMYYLNECLKEITSSNISENYDELDKKFREEVSSEQLKEEWDSFAESIFQEEDVFYQTVDAELFFNENTLLKERMNKKLLDFVPQLLLAIGIFGTFLGLSTGLSGLDLSSGDNSQLNGLISGTKVSFFTSLYGMYFSIILSTIMNIHIGDYEENILKIKNNLNRIFKQALAEKSLIKIEKEIIEVRKVNSKISKAIGDELVKGVQNYNEINEKYMSSLTELVGTNISGLADEVSKMFEDKMHRIFSEEFIKKIEKVNKDTLKISTDNNKNILEYKNEIEKIANSVSEVNKNLIEFNEGILKNFSSVVASYDERFNSILSLFDTSKKNYEEFLALLKEAEKVLKTSNKYMARTDENLEFMDKFIEKEKALIGFWENNQEIVKRLETFFVEQENKAANLNKLNENNFKETEKGLENVLKMYDSNLSEIVKNFNLMIDSLNRAALDLKHDNLSLDKNLALTRDILEKVENVVNGENKNLGEIKKVSE